MGRSIRALVAGLALMAPGTAGAATLHVTPSGSTTSGCTEATPCAITRFDAVAQANDTVLVGCGLYTPAAPVVITKPGLDVRGNCLLRPRVLGVDLFATWQVGTGGAGTALRSLEIESVETDGNQHVALRIDGATTLEGAVVRASGPNGTRGAAEALQVSAPSTLRDVAVRHNGEGGQIGVRVAAPLTLRRVEVVREDIGQARAILTLGAGSLDADELTIRTGGAPCLEDAGAPSVLRRVTAVQEAPAGTSVVLTCVQLHAAGTTVEGLTVTAPGAAALEMAAGASASDVTATGRGGVTLFAAAGGQSATLRRARVEGIVSGIVACGASLVTDAAVRVTGAEAPALHLCDEGPEARNVTAVATGAGSIGLNVAGGPAAGRATVLNTIARGAGSDVVVAGPGPFSGPSSLTIGHSAFDPAKRAGTGTLVDAGGNITADPLLAGDLHLLAGSPAIEAGIADPLNGPTDFEGEPRVRGAAPDIGADEAEPPAVPAEAPPAPATPAEPGQAPPDVTVPVVTRLSISPRSFAPLPAREAAGRGARIRFRLSEAARVTVAVERAARGRRVGRRCRPDSVRLRRRRPCVRWVRRGALSVAGRAGSNSVRFTGRLRGRALSRGSYRAVVTAVDAAGNRSRGRRVSFRIVPG